MTGFINKFKMILTGIATGLIVDHILKRLKKKKKKMEVSNENLKGAFSYINKNNKNAPKYVQYILENAEKYGLDPYVIIAQIYQESRFNPLAINKYSGAKGIGQFMPATWKDFGEGDILNPYDNLDANFRLMKMLIEKFKGRYDLALAGYNWGQNRTLLKNAARDNAKFSEISSKMPKETQDYVKIILNNASKSETIS